jgi:UDP-glucose 4-epimerase
LIKLKVGITGGAGYIGSFLIKKLVETGHEVVSIDNEIVGDYSYLNKMNLGDKLKLFHGDIRDKELLRRIWLDCDVVAHLAALSNLEVCNE